MALPRQDEEMDTLVLDEDKICDELEDQMSEGGNIVDFHTVSCLCNCKRCFNSPQRDLIRDGKANLIPA
jgi:broad-specificity NMP kinase